MVLTEREIELYHVLYSVILVIYERVITVILEIYTLRRVRKLALVKIIAVNYVEEDTVPFVLNLNPLSIIPKHEFVSMAQLYRHSSCQNDGFSLMGVRSNL